MATRKPRLEHYWTVFTFAARLKRPPEVKCNWRLVGANGEIMCQSTQGYRDKTDSRRGFDAVCRVVGGLEVDGCVSLLGLGILREVGPGRKPS